ncbi:O-fucosyltransferase family protein [Caballeronia telluris]|uniref:Nodulation protein Z (NodZ) n=1 Tax=Caballeronia telluris TaxID=326475 RepID=A0A158EPD2_9BURK|nr:hypothetical protein [Caballeronia telluris]SAL09434.1 hypothetical protein AWB66_00086 [Caballeronia telluris]
MLRKVVDRVRQFRRSEGFKHSVATPIRFSLHARQRLNRSVFAIEIRENSGFFSVMQMVLFILMHCDEKRLTPRISARGGLYGDPEGKIDWFSALFETVRPSAGAPSPRKVRTSTVRDLVQLGFRQRYEAGLRLHGASELFRSYYRPAASVREEVESICKRLDIGESTLGVHFRGTDKKIEAMTVPWGDFCRLVEQTLALNPQLTNIFVSSDEQPFIDFFCAWPFSRPVKVAPAKLLSNGDKPIHFSGYPGLEIGREALVSSLLLSNCGYLVKMPSYLSAWSKIFNPDLPVTLAAPPRPDAFWFPDSQIWAGQDVGGKAA